MKHNMYRVNSNVQMYYPMKEFNSSFSPNASNSWSVFARRSPPYVLVYPDKSIFPLKK